MENQLKLVDVEPQTEDDRIFVAIMDAIAQAKLNGLGIRRLGWGVVEVENFDTGDNEYRAEKNCVCPMGAVILGKPLKHSFSYAAAYSLDVHIDYVYGFVTGFDDGYIRAFYEANIEFNNGLDMGKRVYNALQTPA